MIASARGKLRPVMEAAIGFGLILLAWEYGTAVVRIPNYILPVPSAILRRFWETIAVQAHHLGATATTTLIGLALSLFVGVLLALAVIYIRPLKAIVLPGLAAFNSIPKIAIAPLFIIWFGLGMEPKIPQVRATSNSAPRATRASQPRGLVTSIS